MTIEYRNQNTDSGLKVVMTACSFCGERLPDYTTFPDHWPHCPENDHADNGGRNR